MFLGVVALDEPVQWIHGAWFLSWGECVLVFSTKTGHATEPCRLPPGDLPCPLRVCRQQCGL